MIRIEVVQGQGLSAQGQAKFAPLPLFHVQQSQQAHADTVLGKEPQRPLTGDDRLRRPAGFQVIPSKQPKKEELPLTAGQGAPLFENRRRPLVPAQVGVQPGNRGEQFLPTGILAGPDAERPFEAVQGQRELSQGQADVAQVDQRHVIIRFLAERLLKADRRLSFLVAFHQGHAQAVDQVHISGHPFQAAPVFPDGRAVVAFLEKDIAADVQRQGIKENHAARTEKRGVQ